MPRLSIAHGDPVATDAQPPTLSAGLTGGVAALPHGRFVFAGAGGESTASTYAEVFTQARRIVGGLRREGVQPGDPVILHFRAFADFVPALWAALLAGALPLPLMASDWNRRQASRAPQLFRHLRRALDAPRILTDGIGPEQCILLGLDEADLIPLASVETGDAAGAFFDGPPDAPRLLVLSSGTTAAPNLITLSSGALIHRWWPALPDPEHAATFLSWSPFDHVMGLGLASPNLATKVHLPTTAFVQSPALWLAALDRFQVTHCTMTNFGMALVLRAVADDIAAGKTWDLSSVRKIGVGAEAISPELCGRFLAALRPFGLRSDAVILGYGLSECGPVAGGSHAFSPAKAARMGSFPLLDRPTRGHSVRIVDGSGQIAAEGEVGAVEVRGPTMTLGYYGDEPATRALFTADGWIRTGDLGRLHAGRLTITGREKEIIVIHAKKIACVEIEALAERVPGVEAAFAVACRRRDDDGLAGSPEHFAVFVVGSAAVTADLGALLPHVRTRIAAHFGLAPLYLLPIAADDVPRTISGKVQRLELAARLEAGGFDTAIAVVKPLLSLRSGTALVSASEQQIAAIWAELLGVEDCGRDEDFFEVGGDSLTAEVLVVAIERTFGKSLPPDLLQKHTTIARLAAFIDGHAPSEAVSDAPTGRPPAVDPASAISDHQSGGGGHTARRALRHKRNAETLAWSLRVAESWETSLYDRLCATEFLVAYGKVDEGAAAIRRLATVLEQHRLASPDFMQRVIAITARFRRAGIPEAVRKLGDLGRRLLSSDEEAVLWTAEKPDKLLVVFNSMFGDFWVSNPVLHCLIRDERTNILYLKDPSERMFLGGLQAFGGDFDAVVAGIAAAARDSGVSDIRVVGFSSGGYAGLLAATRLGATAYLGFSTRTDLSIGSSLPGSQFVPDKGGIADRVRLDLASLIRERGAPGRGILYYGENEAGDVAHARNLAGLPNFKMKKVPATRHNTVLTLLANGEFERAVKKFLG